MKRRVVVTGMGTVNPLGIGVIPSWQALCEGRSGISMVDRFDCSGMRTTVGGEVKAFCARDFLPEKLARRTDRFQHFALAAAHMAVDDSRLPVKGEFAERVGVSIGTAFGGVETVLAGQDQFRTGGRDEISPFLVPMLLTGMASGQVAMRLGARGPNYSLTTACSAGTHSIGESFKIVQRGNADVMIAGGSEAPLVPVLNQCFGIMGATTAASNPEKASRPFDAERDGFVPAEGAGVIVLEELEFALRRNAPIYAEIVGYSATADAYHVTSPAPGGEGAARCMKLALGDAAMQADGIDYINAHGTSTKLNDSTETEAIKTVFGEHARQIPLSSNKSMLGHTMGASGAIEAIFSVLTIRTGLIPPTVNYSSPDPECDLDCVPNIARQKKVRTVMSNSFGFGGVNGSLILIAYCENRLEA